MKSSKHARRILRHHARLRGRHELNMVPMIDVMVILVFFLIFTAVFSKTNILELNLPAPNSTPPVEQLGFQLEVIVRHDRIEIADRSTGILKTLPSTADGYDMPGLSVFLQRVKVKYPDRLDGNLLLEHDISYDTMIQVMDTMRTFDVPDSKTFEKAELFPDVSIGDAPEVMQP
ncbi:MAG TPA: biopolymer transporter ExbD [Steroidobacteraceae bacterium]|nr:biopolymer transporter ExbD [Steroidobacteraceae bacterium]